jgi:branched-chain amino acid transport system ATP-binding protein
MSKRTLLSGSGVTKRFGGLIALKNIDFHIDSNEIVGLIGPNGAGKTTLFNCITGFLKPDVGKIIFKDEDITGLDPYEITKRGISRTFQLIRVFPELTVLKNVLIGSIVKHNKFTNLMTSYSKSDMEKAEQILNSLGLAHLRDRPVKNLSLGERKLLEFGIALMSDPEILLLDEPTSGLSDLYIERIKEAIIRLHKDGRTVFVIEHNISFATDICERIYVLDHGEKIFDGTPDEMLKNKKVIEAYFGA